MRHLLTLCVAMLLPGLALAQGNHICLFADPGAADCHLTDTTPGVLSVYAIHINSPGATAAEFSAPKPTCFTGTWLADTSPWPVMVGDSQSGVALGFGECITDATNLLLTIQYFGNGTTGPDCLYPVMPDPDRSDVIIVDCDENLVVVTGGTSHFNSTLPCNCGTSAPPELHVQPAVLDFGNDADFLQMDIINTGGSGLNWIASASQPWIILSEVSGSTSRKLDVFVSRNGVPDGLHTGSIDVVSNGGNASVQVTMTVGIGGTPVLEVTPASFSFPDGSSQQSIHIDNVGTGTLSWTISSDQPWLLTQFTSGVGPLTFKVSVTRVGLVAGIYNGNLTITSNGGNATVPVTMEVVQNPVLAVSPSALDFSTTQTTKTLSIANDGTGTLSWSVASDQPWLSASPTSGTNDASVTVAVDRTGLTPGTYNGTLSVTSDGGNVDVAVTMEVASIPLLLVSPLMLDFGSSATTLPVTISNVGTGTLSWSVSSNRPWLSASPLSGSNDATIDVTIDRTGLANGTYNGTLSVTSNGGSAVVSVTMVVATNPVLSVSPTLLDYGNTQTTLAITITNTGFGTLQWNLTEGAPWYTVSQSAGTGDATVDVTVDRTGLADGTYEAGLSVTSNGGNAMVVVRMTVLTTPVLAVSPIAISFSPTVTTRDFTISNAGVGTLQWMLTENLDWIDIVPPLSGTGPATVTVNLIPENLPGTFAVGEISVESNGGNAEVTVVYKKPTPGSGGWIGVYADPSGSSCEIREIVGLLPIYVVHTNMTGATASEFAARAPSCFLSVYLGDTAVFPITIGDSQSGVSIGYGTCVAAPAHILTINYFSQQLTPPCCYYPTLPHLTTGRLQATNCALERVAAQSHTSVINANTSCFCGIKTHESTWGKVKALYAPER